MDNNNFILGRIPSNGGGICKTYEESMLEFVISDEYKTCLMNNKTFFYNIEYEYIYINEENEKKNPDDKELVVLSILPYGGASQYGGLYFEYIVELIDKDILKAHLLDERMLLEEQKTLTLD